MGKSQTTNLQTIEDKLYISSFRPDLDSHIKANQATCLICQKKECTKFCPANVFAWSLNNDELIVGYENCLECGACKIGCPYGSIEYNHPKVGCGIF